MKMIGFIILWSNCLVSNIKIKGLGEKEKEKKKTRLLRFSHGPGPIGFLK